jgi:hypothetical protein
MQTIPRGLALRSESDSVVVPISSKTLSTPAGKTSLTWVGDRAGIDENLVCEAGAQKLLAIGPARRRRDQSAVIARDR